MRESTLSGELGAAAAITKRQAGLGLTDAQVAAALGYDNEKVIAMMKNGSIRIPINKVAALAECLQMDRFDLLSMVMTEASPEMWRVIQETAAPLGALHTAEVNLLRHLRELRGGRQFAPVVLDGRSVVALVTTE